MHTSLQSSGATLSAIQSSLQHEDAKTALTLARDLTRAYPKNTFVLGLFKLIERSTDGKQGNTPFTDSLRDRLPLLITRALDTTKGVAPQQQKARHQTKGADQQKRKALEQVKAQYLKIADGYMRKGEFELALAEVHRALIIDPEDETANGYATKLEELVNLQSSDSITGKKDCSAMLDSNPAIMFDKPPSLEELVTMTKTDFDSIVARSAHKLEKPVFIDPTPTQLHMKWEDPPAHPPRRRSMNSFLIGSAFLIIVAIAASYFLTGTSEPDIRTAQQQRVEAASLPVTQISVKDVPQEDSLHVSTSNAQSDSIHTNNRTQQ